MEKVVASNQEQVNALESRIEELTEEAANARTNERQLMAAELATVTVARDNAQRELATAVQERDAAIQDRIAAQNDRDTMEAQRNAAAGARIAAVAARHAAEAAMQREAARINGFQNRSRLRSRNLHYHRRTSLDRAERIAYLTNELAEANSATGVADARRLAVVIQRDEARAERDQLRAQVAAARAALNGAGSNGAPGAEPPVADGTGGGGDGGNPPPAAT